LKPGHKSTFDWSTLRGQVFPIIAVGGWVVAAIIASIRGRGSLPIGLWIIAFLWTAGVAIDIFRRVTGREQTHEPLSPDKALIPELLRARRTRRDTSTSRRDT